MSDLVQLQIEHRITQIVADYDTRRLLGDIAVRFANLGNLREALMVVSAVPRWDDRTLTLNFPAKFVVFAVRSLYRAIASVLRHHELSDAILTWSGAKHKGFRIVAAMADGDDIFADPPPLDTRASQADYTELLRIGDMVRGSENPIGVVLLDSDWQIWGNEALSGMTGKPLETLCKLNVRGNWVNQRVRTDDGLSNIKQRLRTDGDFVTAYQTKMGPEATSKHDFESRFRLMLDGRLRVTEVYSWRPVT